jgi:Mrp family chromosome partitioning ATPase
LEKIQQAIERARQQRASLMPEGPRPTAAAAGGGRSPTSFDAILQAATPIELDQAHLRTNRLVTAFVDDPQTDIFRAMRTQVLLRLPTLGGRSLAIVSARDGEGKTFVACNLALSLARQAEAPVFLVDLDFRRPSLHTTLGIAPRQGIADVIEGHADLEDVLLQVDGTNLFILPQPTKRPHASELISATRTRDLVRMLVDGCLLVVQQGRTRRDEVLRAAELMDETKYIGSVVNRGDAAEAQAYYGYR